MFKSLSKSLRSLWQSGTDEAVQEASRKRKRPSNEGDQEDCDVEILSVKIPRKESADSGPGLLSLLKVPMSKMSDWVREKTVRKDHIFVRPIPQDSHWQRRERVFREMEAAQDGPVELDAHNGALGHHYWQNSRRDTCQQDGDTDRLSPPPIPCRNGTHEHGVNGERGMGDEQAGGLNSSVASSRRSSCSSSRPATDRPTTVDKCFHLKERENYLKLLQQFTTVDLGYHGSRNKMDHCYGASGDETHLRRKPGLYLPVPSVPCLSSTSVQSFMSASDRHHPSSRVQVTPSRFLHTSSLPSDKAPERPISSSSTSSSARERLAVSHRPGRALRVESTPRLTGRMQQKSLPPGSSQHCTAPTIVSHTDHGVKVTADPEGDGRLKVSPHSDADQQFKGMPDSLDQQVKVRPPSDGSQRLTGIPVAGPDHQPGVTEGHGTSPVKQSIPGLNFKSSEYLEEDWLSKLNKKYASSERDRQQLITEAEVKKKVLEERREARLANLEKKLKQQMRLFDEEPEVIEELPLPEVPQEKPLPELTESMLREVRCALGEGPPQQVLAEGFRLQLTRADMATLRGLNWLNDEVINFYMNMLMERGEQEGFRKTYAFNTFFYPKLLGGGHAAVKRWTRKVDIFAYHYLIIPVHLGVHWCLCMVFVKDKKICYYDSMGGNNNQCLNTIRQYLCEESLQKRNVPLDLSEWSTEIVKEIPQQMNGSDCGMFTCMYAESLTRAENITFTQKDMPYFRKRMVYEILKKKLL